MTNGLTMAIEALEWVRQRPAQFFPNGVVDPIMLAAYVMADVVTLGGGSCTIRHRDRWWVVGSEIDWLAGGPTAPAELFNRVVPAAAHGEHSMRAEVLLHAFAESVSTVLDGHTLTIAGEVPPVEVQDEAVGLRRAILYRLPAGTALDGSLTPTPRHQV